MKTISIHLKDKSTAVEEYATAEFEDNEVALFEDYLLNTERLLQSAIIREGMPGNLKINYSKATGLTCEINLPDEDNILAFLHRMRRFILNDERSSYNRVTGIIGRRFQSDGVRAFLKTQRKIYDGKAFQGMIEIHSNGTMINCEKTLADWLNAFEYHNDETKRAEIEKLHQIMPLEASRAVFLMLLTEKVKAIVAVADFIALLVGKVASIETKA